MRRLMMIGATAAAMAVTATNAEAQREDSFSWRGELGAQRTIHLHNVNGEVRIEQGSGRTVELSAVKRWRRGDPDDVRIEARVTSAGDVVICALYGERQTCDEEGIRGRRDENRRWRDDNDVSVDFTVKIPADARVDAGTVNGDLIIGGTAGSINARTVNGDIEARSTAGRVDARTTNGSITVRTAAPTNDGLEYSTVNGSITIEMPAGVNADVDLRTVNGRISSDFPMTLDGSINPRRIRASIGNGGPALRVSTVNGSIRLRKL